MLSVSEGLVCTSAATALCCISVQASWFLARCDPPGHHFRLETVGKDMHHACTSVHNHTAHLAQQPAPIGAGFEDLHSFAFLGKSGRIGTASDGLFSYVPAGPNKQIDMFLHAYDLRKAGRMQVRHPFNFLRIGEKL